MRRLVAALLLVLPLGCMGNANSPGERIDLTGEWIGQVRVAFDADTVAAPMVLVIQEALNTGRVTGVMTIADLGEDLIVTGENRGAELVIETRSDDPDSDCNLHVQSWEFRVQVSQLRLRSANGDICQGDAQDGDPPVREITGASGVLELQ